MVNIGLTWIVSTGEVSSKLYLRPWKTATCWIKTYFWVTCLFEEGDGLGVVLKYCEHGLQQASLDGEQLQHLGHYSSAIWKTIFDIVVYLHHKLAQSFPTATFLQLDFIAVEDIVVKVHVIPGIKNCHQESWAMANVSKNDSRKWTWSVRKQQGCPHLSWQPNTWRIFQFWISIYNFTRLPSPPLPSFCLLNSNPSWTGNPKRWHNSHNMWSMN